ncbi:MULTISPECIES: hypothetical protein [Streptomyces]|uniref:hypothetical protein n=1 Tax=Streptomyces TaxID=1883 RepID=UPI00148A0C1B|nr:MULTISPECIES: hypothetical protein [Streptomyces]
MAASKVPEDSTLPVASSSINVVGGMRPPVPITTGAGSALVPSSVMDGEVSSLMVRLAVEEPPGRYSATLPLTATSSPACTVGVREV